MSDWQPAEAQRSSTQANRTSDGVRLGPMTLADIVDNSFRLFKANWKQLALIVLIVSIPSMILAVVLQGIGGYSLTDTVNQFQVDFSSTETTAEEPLTVTDAVVTALQSLVALFVLPFAMAVIARVVTASYMGQRLDGADAARGLLKRWPGLILASVLSLLTVLGASMIVVIPAVVLAVIHPLFALLLVFTILPVIVVSVLLSAVIPAIAVEEATAVQAMGRSWALMRRRFWPYLGAIAVIYIVAVFASSIVALVIVAFQGLAEYLWFPLSYPFVALSTFGQNLVLYPIIAIGITLIYFDARIRAEGFDLQVAASRLPNGASEGQGEATGQSDLGKPSF